MVEFVEPVLVALTAGAAIGAGEAASTAVQDAYQGLKTAMGKLLRREVSGSAEADAAVEEQLADPRVHQGELEAALARADADEQAELLAAARKVLELVGPESGTAGKYRLELRDNKGVQVGDHNTQTNHFGA